MSPPGSSLLSSGGASSKPPLPAAPGRDRGAPGATTDVEQLAAQLADKDNLVNELTAQLERAAEQLDRFQRSGADRRRGAGGGFLPSELAEDHKQLLGDMQRVVQQWEDLQAGLTLGRIEVQIGELRDFIADRLHGGSGSSGGGGGGGYTSTMSTHLENSTPEPVVEEPCEIPAAAPASSESSSWDRIKSQLFPSADGTPSEPQPAFDEPLPEPPAPVDWSTATQDTIVEAVEVRDEFISHLLRRLRAAETVSLPADWTQFDQQNPEWAERIQLLARQLDEKLRMSEIEFSLERAKLAREHGRLLHQQELIDKNLKKLGLGSVEEAEQSAPETGTQQDRRWMRFLGSKNKPQ